MTIKRYRRWMPSERTGITGRPLGFFVLAPALHYVEGMTEWPAVLRHNLHSAAILCALADAR